MDNIFIAFFATTVVGLLATNLLWVAHVRELNQQHQQATERQLRELDKFYFGFCLEAKQQGYGTLPSYPHLCGDVQ